MSSLILNDLVYLDESDLRWCSNDNVVGCIVKYKDNKYRAVSQRSSLYKLTGNRLVHRIIWCLLHGSIPEDLTIDHIDGNGLNNSVINMRLVDKPANNRNQKLRNTNKSGVQGVSLRKDTGKWSARIRDNNGKYPSKSFSSFEEAVQWRKDKEQEYGYHVNHGIQR